MARVIVVTSGKGGVGKTTTSANIAFELASRGHPTCVVDFDIGLRNLDLVLGCERRVVYDLVNVLQGEARLSQALIRDKREKNLAILPASQTKNKDVLTLDGVGRIIAELAEEFSYIVCDSPAGIEQGAMHAMYYADDAFVVVNPEVSSVRDADRMIGLLTAKSRRAQMGEPPIKEYLLVTRYQPKRVAEGEMLSADDIIDTLRIKLLGVIPESSDVLQASNSGEPVVQSKSQAGEAYKDIVGRYLGEDVPLRFMNVEGGFFSRLFKWGK